MKPKTNAKKITAKPAAKRGPGRPKIHSPNDVADNMRHAEALWGIPRTLQILAKAAGCPAFEKSRVQRKPLEAWIAANPQIKDAAKSHDDAAELKRQKLALEVSILETKDAQQRGDLIPRIEAEGTWSICSAIVREEAKGLMEKDHYRVFIERIKARLGKVLESA